MRFNYRKAKSALAVYFLLNNTGVFGDVALDDLLELREVNQYEWLTTKLEILALKMSYPAYRIDIVIDSDQGIQFTYNFSGAMAKHFTETIEKSEAQKAMSYHAQGLSKAVEALILNEFQNIGVNFDPDIDFQGRFLGPGYGNDVKPREIGRWKNSNFEWVR